MSRVFLFALCGLISSAAAFADDSSAWLYWKNGDSMKGTMLPSEAGDVIRWKSDMFVDPFDIRISQLKMVKFGAEKESETKAEPFRITMMSGDVISGDLISITADTVTLKSGRLQNGEELAVARKNVASLERMDSPNLMFAGPHNMTNWKSVTRDRKISDWNPTSGGRLKTNRWRGDLFREFKHPEKLQIEFNLQSQEKPLEFIAGFFLDPALGPAIETWDDVVVLSYGNDFTPLLEVSEGTKNLRFRVFWDQKTGVISAHDANGKMLGKLEKVKGMATADKSASANRRRSVSGRTGDSKAQGFSLLNKSTDMVLGDLRVRKWDGALPKEITADKSRVEFSDGNAAYSEVKSLNNGILEMADGGAKPIGDVDHILFDLNPQNLDAPAKPEERDVFVTWMDGTVISGKLKGLNGDTTAMQVPWASDPVTATLGSTRKIAFFGTEEVEKGAPDELIIGKTVLKGRLSLGEKKDGEALVMWMPTGANNASALNDDVVGKIVRTAAAGQIRILGQGRVYLKNDEVLSGKLISIEKDGVNFQSEYTGQVKLDPKNIRAIDIEAAAAELKGFGDDGWETFPDEVVGENSVKLDKDKVVLVKGALGHRSLLAGDEITFDAEWKTPFVGAFTLRLFLSDFAESSPSTDIVFAAQSSRLYLGETKDNGQFNFSGEQIPLTKGKASFRITNQGSRIQVYVDGQRRLTVPLDPAKQSGNGLMITEGGGWQGFNRNSMQITFTNFEVKRTSGYVPVRVIDPKAKREVLTIPRFRRDNPDSHVIIAPNGDLLRGRLIAASGDKIKFTSKLDTFDFPRERVSTIVWLKPSPEDVEKAKAKAEKNGEKPKTEAEPSKFVPTHHFVLHDGTRLSLKSKEIDRDKFIGESEALGRCEIPLRSVREIRHEKGGDTTKKDKNLIAYADWVLVRAPEPVIPTDDGGESSPLMGEEVKDFKLAMLDGGEFQLSNLRGKVVVLDFWATWCGPCIRAMPEIFQGIAPYGDKIAFMAVNEGETGPIIEKFLEQRSWAGIPVGLDTRQTIGDQFQVQGIPHTVVIGKDGKIAWVHSGFKEGMGEDLSKAIAKALEAE